MWDIGILPIFQVVYLFGKLYTCPVRCVPYWKVVQGGQQPLFPQFFRLTFDLNSLL